MGPRASLDILGTIKHLAPVGIRAPDRPTSSQVATILTTPSWPITRTTNIKLKMAAFNTNVRNREHDGVANI